MKPVEGLTRALGELHNRNFDKDQVNVFDARNTRPYNRSGGQEVTGGPDDALRLLQNVSPIRLSP